ncbi:enoyl-CoA hydratase/isomerase family protein [Erythrobacter alti]|uniref:enoyl-CoA hydratase/isomerase family protein n=1 Tax=Erythrobacter alti TaxID=1896145 RepID=UPI0030F49D80
MSLPELETIELRRDGRLLTIAFNRPEAMNAFDKTMHDELPAALDFAREDQASDVIVLTGNGKAFSAGGDFTHIQNNAANPADFDHEITMARQIVETLVDIEKPVVCGLNGHAVGLGATIALLCDIIYASSHAKIGDPHVNIGLVAGDGGVLAWPQRIGLTRAKEYLLTGELIGAEEAVTIGLINRACPADELEGAITQLCNNLLSKPQFALRKTKALTNLELKRLIPLLFEPGIAWEAESVRDADHREAIAALVEKRETNFRRD